MLIPSTKHCLWKSYCLRLNCSENRACYQNIAPKCSYQISEEKEEGAGIIKAFLIGHKVYHSLSQFVSSLFSLVAAIGIFLSYRLLNCKISCKN